VSEKRISSQSELCSEIAKGVLFCDIIEVASGHKFKGLNRQPLTKRHFSKNIKQGIEALSKMKIFMNEEGLAKEDKNTIFQFLREMQNLHNIQKMQNVQNVQNMHWKRIGEAGKNELNPWMEENPEKQARQERESKVERILEVFGLEQ